MLSAGLGFIPSGVGGVTTGAPGDVLANGAGAVVIGGGGRGTAGAWGLGVGDWLLAGTGFSSSPVLLVPCPCLLPLIGTGTV